MNVAWMYLDKKAATLKAINDYYCMVQIIQNYETAIEEARTKMILCGSSVASMAQRPSGALSCAEERVADSIDAIDLIKGRYRRAVEYMDWFLPAWNALDESERLILEAFYQNGNMSKNTVINGLSRELFVERTQVYRLKDKAVDRLAMLLYGR